MKFLLTGGAGFIGSHIADKLLLEDHHVTVIDNLSTGLKSNIEHNLNNSNFLFIKADIGDTQKLSELIANNDCIIHLACAVGVKYVLENKLRSLNSNILNTISVVQHAATHNKKIVFFSSSEIYGKNNEELRENSDRIIGSSFRWNYSIGKSVGEYYLKAYGEQSNLQYITLRCFNIVGSRQLSNYGMFLPRLVKQALSEEPMTVYDSGQQVRSFTDIDDLKNILYLLLFNQSSWGKTINLGSKNSISIQKLAEKIKKKTGSVSDIIHTPSKLVYGEDFEDIEIRVPDNNELVKLVGNYKFSDIDTIIEKCIRWSKENKVTLNT
ncbi:MAG: NAD-dependent epimerase/dehydratase family protein [Oscillospiraceae bacterium]|jgi:UDP-glucose 4-epimerase|nr:NAD-dependent epimerase/dehydratase family protein [Oscillospiraceae bacterium]